MKKRVYYGELLANYYLNIGKALEISRFVTFKSIVHGKDYDDGEWTFTCTEKELTDYREKINKYQKLKRHKSNQGKDYFTCKLMERIHTLAKQTKGASIPCNQCIVIMITAFEVFLHDVFSYFLNENKNIKDKLIDSDAKVKLSLVEEYKNGEKDFSEIVIDAKKYNFQNIDSIRAAFLWLENVDLFKLLSFECEIGKEKLNSIDVLQRTILLRHRIVHEAYNDNTLDYKIINDYYCHVFYEFGMIITNELVFRKGMEQRLREEHLSSTAVPNS